ncbi:MAG: hypothetical protein IPF48_10885 [Sphingomonadales bacterium]|nr:hypothetical protein [Sphingomonadales bacterium]
MQDQVKTWANAVTLSSFECTRGYEPELWSHRLAPRGLLVIVADDDRVTPASAGSIEAFARAGEPKRLVHLPGGHFDVYERPGFDRAMDAAIDWYREHLA